MVFFLLHVFLVDLYAIEMPQGEGGEGQGRFNSDGQIRYEYMKYNTRDISINLCKCKEKFSLCVGLRCISLCYLYLHKIILSKLIHLLVGGFNISE